MDEQQNNVETVDAREASKSRVVTQETLMASLQTAQAASAPTETDSEKASAESVKVTDSEEQTNQVKVKKSPQERIQELANLRRDSERKATDALKENEELRARIKALETVAPAIQVEAKPERHEFNSESEYIESYTDWKAKKVIAAREAEVQQAKVQATHDEIQRLYNMTAEVAKLKYDDFDSVVSNTRIAVPDVIMAAIIDSPVGGELTYYLAKNENELKKLVDTVMLERRPTQAIRKLAQLERELMATDDGPDEAEDKKPIQKKRPPEPISPVHGLNVISPSNPVDFDSYRAKRKAEMRNK